MLYHQLQFGISKRCLYCVTADCPLSLLFTDGLAGCLRVVLCVRACGRMGLRLTEQGNT